MAKQYDLVVVGTGTAATVAAMRVRSAGRSVAVVDFRPFGGTCRLRRCDPKKMLVSGATAADHARRMYGKGIAGETRIEVTVLEQAPRVLGPFDPDLVGWLVEKSRDIGIDVRPPQAGLHRRAERRLHDSAPRGGRVERSRGTPTGRQGARSEREGVRLVYRAPGGRADPTASRSSSTRTPIVSLAPI